MDRMRATRAAAGVAAVAVAAWGFVIFGAPDADSEQIHVEEPRVIDGDTFRTGAGETIRLWGIDAPEIDAPGGRHALFALHNILSTGGRIACWRRDTGPYGRTIARCENELGRDIACLLVGMGYARDWPRYSGGHYADCAS